MRQIELHSRVRIITDRFRHEGAARGTIGYAVHDWKDAAGQVVGYEVGVMDERGYTIALLSALRDEVERFEAMRCS